MNLPGFTAEASAYKTSSNYQMAGTPKDLTVSRTVIPQRFCGPTLKKCVEGYLNNDPTAIISCNMYMAFCMTVADWVLVDIE